ncbi:MAG: type II and III secretion system protein [Planctomycetota bacterium]
MRRNLWRRALWLFGAAAGCTAQEPAERARYAFRVDPSVEGVSLAAAGAWPRTPGPLGPPSRQDEEGLADISESLFHRFQRGVIFNDDGTLTKLYYFRSGRAKDFEALLLAHVPEFAALPEAHRKSYVNFLQDPRLPNAQSWVAGLGVSTGVGPVADILVVRAPEEAHVEIDRFLDKLIVDPPQVEIEAQVVEIKLDERLEWGISALVTRGSETDPESTFFKQGSLTLPAETQEGVSLDFLGIHDETTAQVFIDFIATNTNSDVLAMPKMLVLNGHRGVIDTGEETPVLVPTIGATGDVTGGAIVFKPTGIRLIIVPWILLNDVVQLDVYLEVSAVTGFLTVGTIAGSPIETPEVAVRRALTMVNVGSGQTLAIGGLLSTIEIDKIVKVPVLGDIPLLGYLFKSRVRSKQRSEVIFFITPRIKTLEEEVLFDPMRR